MKCKQEEFVWWNIFQHSLIAEKTGTLGVLEQENPINFNIKRIFYLKDLKSDVVRGKHSHKELKQILVCLNGTFSIDLDNTYEKLTLDMKDNQDCLYLDGKVWRRMYNFSNDCIILVLCDREYKFDEVVRNYSEFENNIIECKK